MKQSKKTLLKTYYLPLLGLLLILLTLNSFHATRIIRNQQEFILTHELPALGSSLAANLDRTAVPYLQAGEQLREEIPKEEELREIMREIVNQQMLQSYRATPGIHLYLAQPDGKILYASNKELLKPPGTKVQELWGDTFLETMRRNRLRTTGRTLFQHHLWIRHLPAWDTHLIVRMTPEKILSESRKIGIQSFTAGGGLVLVLFLLILLVIDRFYRRGEQREKEFQQRFAEEKARTQGLELLLDHCRQQLQSLLRMDHPADRERLKALDEAKEALLAPFSQDQARQDGEPEKTALTPEPLHPRLETALTRWLPVASRQNILLTLSTGNTPPKRTGDQNSNSAQNAPKTQEAQTQDPVGLVSLLLDTLVRTILDQALPGTTVSLEETVSPGECPVVTFSWTPQPHILRSSGESTDQEEGTEKDKWEELLVELLHRTGGQLRRSFGEWTLILPPGNPRIQKENQPRGPS